MTVGFCFAIKYAAAILVFGTGTLNETVHQGLGLVAGNINIELPSAIRSLFESLGLPIRSTGGVLNTVFWLAVSLALATPAMGLGSIVLGAAVPIVSAIIIVAGLFA